jgi:hypothetical protein
VPSKNNKKERQSLFFIIFGWLTTCFETSLFRYPQQGTIKNSNHSTKGEYIYKPLFSISQAIALFFQIYKPNQT